MRFLQIFFLITMLSDSLIGQPTTQPDTLLIFSEAMQKNIPALIVLPSQYDAQDSSKTYPTLYMLHGYSGDFMGFYLYMPDLQALSNQYNMILVCPDGGFNSWYMDAPFGDTCRYETFISRELVAYIDSHFNTYKEKSQRAICGLSMGGHGALYNAIRNPEVFGAAGSMSGGVDFTPFPMEWELSHRLGQYAFNKALWQAHCVTNMIDKIPKDLKMIIDCGTKDFFMPMNRTFHEKLLKARIPHDYIERNGSHDWEYWANATRFQMLFFHYFFTNNK